jgi:adenylate cyclase
MACLKMREKLGELNTRRLDSGKPPLTIGMGLHAGPAISGTIGSSERMEYTVIGDTVNTTSRIEASTKVFGTDLLISDEVIALVGDRFKNEFVGAVEVKGRSVPLKLHRVIGYKDANNQFVEVITPYSEYTAEGDAKVKIKSTAA